jgi:uncharacterized protein (TIGR04255 family)
MSNDWKWPNYRRPPVVEVVASAFFQELPPQAIAHLSSFWIDEASEAYPNLSLQPPYQAQIERFGAEAKHPRFEFHIGRPADMPRLWFQSSTNEQLLQVQANWFACNWRKVAPEDRYGRWPSRRAEFEQWFGRLQRYLAARGMEPLQIQQCEVTYVNHVPRGQTWSTHGELHKVLNYVQESQLPPGLASEQAGLTQQFLASGPSGPSGRLRLSAQPAYRADDEPIWVLEFTARVLVREDRDVLMSLDEGRRWIVQAFHQFTTDEIRAEWGEFYDSE